MPDVGGEFWISYDRGGASDADLVVVGRQIAEFDFWVLGQLLGLLIGFEASDVDGKILVDADWRDRSKPGLLAIDVDGGELREFGGLDSFVGDAV